jgi:PAS domain S-box-containing protein
MISFLGLINGSDSISLLTDNNYLSVIDIFTDSSDKQLVNLLNDVHSTEDIFPSGILDKLKQLVKDPFFSNQGFIQTQFGSSPEDTFFVKISAGRNSSQAFLYTRISKEGMPSAKSGAKALQVISDAAISFQNSAGRQDLFVRLISVLEGFVPDSWIFIASTGRNNELRMSGANPKVLRDADKVAGILGLNLFDIEFQLSDIDTRIFETFTRGFLEKFPSLFELTGQLVDRHSCEKISRELGIGSVYGIGLNHEQAYFGALCILSPDEAVNIHPELIESIVRQASYTLQRLSAQESQFASDQLYHQIFSATDEAILISEMPSGRINDANPAAIRMFGCEDLVQLKESAFFGFFAEGLAEKLRQNQPFGHENTALYQHIFEWQAIRQNGSWFWCELSVRSFSVADNHFLLSVIRDVSESKKVLLNLQEKHQNLSRRLDTLIQPEVELDQIQLTDLFDLDEIQKIQDAFSDVTGVASVITDAKGVPVTRPSNFCELCEKVIRGTEIGRVNCFYSDSVIGALNKSGPTIQPCLSGALMDAGSSISVGGIHIANWMIGQVINDDADVSKLSAYAGEIGADEKAYSSALSKVKRMPAEQFKRIAETLYLFANQLSLKATQNLQQARELAERQRIEQESIEVRRKLETLMGNLPGMAYRCRNDRDYTMEFVSRGAFELTGYKPEELINNARIAFNDLIVRDYQNYLWEKWQEVISSNSIFTDEYQITTASGEIKWVWEQGCGIYNQSGEVVAIEGLIIDITSRKEAAARLIESELRFRKLFEDSDDANLIIENGVFIDFNEAALRMLRSVRSEVINKMPSELSPSRQPDGIDSSLKAMRMIETARKNGSHRFDWLHKRPDGSQFWVEVLLTVINIDDKEILYTTWRDITERKKADQDLRQMNVKLAKLNAGYLELNKEIERKNEELRIAIGKAEESDKLKSAFLANMSHEIRTPMNGILGFADLLLTPGLSHEDMASFIGIINTCSAQLMALINDIIDISRIEAGQITISRNSVSLQKLMSDLYSISSKNPQLRAMLIAPVKEHDEDLFISGDEVRLRQIMLNLISNAIKFTKQGSIEFGYIQLGNTIRFYVKDTGIGIDPEHHEVIFKRFRQVNSSVSREQGGTGLGLAISKALVEQMGGTITLESTLGKGSVFMVDLPFEKIGATGRTQSEKAPSESIVRFPGKRILVAEDDDTNFTLLKMMLKYSGCEINRAYTGIEAVELALSWNPDLILMDIKMPEMNGLDATRAIRLQKPSQFIIAVTAFALSDDRNRALDAGCDDYISKPITQMKLFEKIGRFLPVE